MMQILRTVRKVPMKKAVILLMTFLILLSFSGCTERVENTPPDGKTTGGNMIEGTVEPTETMPPTADAVEPTESTPSTADAEESTADPTESGSQETEALIGPSGVKLRTWDKLIYLAPKAGHLEFRFDNARAVNHRSDVQEECLLLSDCSRHYSYDASQYSAEDFPNAENVRLLEGTWYVRYDYPNWVEDDGYFGDGVYLILVDVTATNVGAENYTTADRYSEIWPRGQYDDPYIFGASVVPVLTDISGTYWLNENSRLWYTQPVYFSLLNQRSEHPFAFRLAPGESITYTLGFLVTDYELGGYFSLPHLCFNDTMGSLDGAFYKLDIDWSATR